jgi:hypothetical protein
VSWTLDIDESRLSVNGAEQLRQQLVGRQSDKTKPPAIALLTAPDGSCLGIGLGHPLSTLTYIAPGGWPSKHSLGVEGDGLVAYQLEGQVSELPARCMIPLEKALRVATMFFSANKLGDEVEWEED